MIRMACFSSNPAAPPHLEVLHILLPLSGNGSAGDSIGSCRSSHILASKYIMKDTYSKRLLHRGSARAAPIWLETALPFVVQYYLKHYFRSKEYAINHQTRSLSLISYFTSRQVCDQ
ncbi:hypothetical protein SDJN03_01597, partial [Cucurbita argyrosperma subsp. sororia]